MVRLSGYSAKVEPVEAIKDAYTAMRPSYSVLDNMMLRMSSVDLLPDWKVMLKEYMEQRAAKKQGRM